MSVREVAMSIDGTVQYSMAQGIGSRDMVTAGTLIHGGPYSSVTVLLLAIKFSNS